MIEIILLVYVAVMLLLFYVCGRRWEDPGDYSILIILWPIAAPMVLAYKLGEKHRRAAAKPPAQNRRSGHQPPPSARQMPEPPREGSSGRKS